MTSHRTIRTMCPMNCHPTLCGMKVEVAPGGDVRIEGDETNPDSRGFLCMRGNAAHEIVGNSERLLKPLIRRERGVDDWREATWDEALDLIADRMRAVGPAAVGMWQGHGNAANDYGAAVKRTQMDRFANLYGCQRWNPAMICWGLGGFGVGLTGALETTTKEDMGANAEMILMWGANTVSQANTTPHVDAAKRRGAKIVTIDMRRTEASALADEAFIVRPGSDAALALAMMHVIVGEGLHDEDYVAAHTVGFADLRAHLEAMTPEWAESRTGVEAARIRDLARAYARTRPAAIVLGGSSIHKGGNLWHAGRAIACLPALVGDYGRPGGGFGPRHGAKSHGFGLVDISAADRRPPGDDVPNQMEAIVEALESRRVKVFFALGANTLSSFPDANRMRRALEAQDLVVGYDLFMNQALRQTADVVLPGTIWLEEVGVKATNTHIHLCDRALDPAGDARPLYELYKGLADRLGVEDVYPWPDQEAAIDAVLDHPATGRATVASMRAGEGRAALRISPHSYPTHEFDTPSGKIEFRSDRAASMGLPALPVAEENDRDGGAESDAPLSLAFGRTFAHFHGFYDNSRALPTLAAREPEPLLWISPADAAARGLADGDAIRVENHRGSMAAVAKVTPRIPQGAVWMRDGWPDLNTLTDGAAILPDAALGAFPFSVGQSSYEARVDVRPA